MQLRNSFAIVIQNILFKKINLVTAGFTLRGGTGTFGIFDAFSFRNKCEDQTKKKKKKREVKPSKREAPEAQGPWLCAIVPNNKSRSTWVTRAGGIISLEGFS